MAHGHERTCINRSNGTVKWYIVPNFDMSGSLQILHFLSFKFDLKQHSRNE